METWKHPVLGKFKFDYVHWTADCCLPAFKVFRYRWRRRHVGRARIPLRFDAKNTDELPSDRMVAVALRVIRNHQKLIDRLKRALWNDLHGRGPDSGMWWHGDLNTINRAIAGAFRDRTPRRFREPDDLYDLLGSPSISISETTYGYGKPSARICFEAAFEVEHGVGVLTDGNRILGTGYEIGVSPFGSHQRRQAEWIGLLRRTGLISGRPRKRPARK